MARVGKILLVLFASAACLVVLATIALTLINDDSYRRWLIRATESATGRELAIDGEFSVDLGTTVRVTAGDISLTNAGWATDPKMLVAEHLELAIELWPLVNRVLDISLRADSPQVSLEVDSTGLGNWTMESDPTDSEDSADRTSGGASFRILPRDIEINNANVRFLRGGRTNLTEIERLRLNAKQGRYGVELIGRHNAKPMDLTGDFGDVDRLRKGATTDIRVDGRMGPVLLSVAGTIAEALNRAGPTVDLTTVLLQGPAVDALDLLITGDMPDLGMLEVGAERITGSAGVYAATGLMLNLTGAATTIGIEGQIDDLGQMEGVSLGARVIARGLDAIVAAFGIHTPIPLPEYLEASGELSGGATGLSLSGFQANLQDEQLQVSVTGSAVDLLTQRGVAGDASVAAASLASLSKFVDRELPETGPIKGVFRIAAEDAVYTLTDLKLSIQGDELKGQLAGSIGDLQGLQDIDLTLGADVSSLAVLSKILGKALPDSPPVALTLRVSAEESIRERGEVFARIEADWLEAEAQGEFERLLELQGLQGDISLKTPTLASAGNLFGKQWPELGPLEVSGQVRGSGVTHTLENLEVNLNHQQLRAKVTGSIRNLLGLQGLNLDFAGRVNSLQRLSKITGATLPELGAVEVQGSISAKSEISKAAALEFEVNSGAITVSADGTVMELATLEGLDLGVALEAPTLADIGRLADADLSSAGPVKGAAQLTRRGRDLTFDAIDLNIGNTRVAGSLRHTVNPSNPDSSDAIDARLRSDYIDLNELLGIDLQAATEATPEPAAAVDAETASQPSERVFSDAPFRVELLQDYHVDLAIHAKRMRIRYFDFDQVNSSIEVNRGRARIALSNERGSRRPIDVTVLLDVGTQPATFHMTIDLDQIRLPPLAQLNAPLQGGVVLLKVNMKGSGMSMRDVMSHLDGHALIALRDSRTPNSRLTRFGGGASIATINPFESSEDYTTLYCGAAYFDFTDGVATTPDGLAVQLPRVTWLGSGRVNLKTEEIDVRATPHARRGLFGAGTLANMVQLRGTLANPRLVANPAGMARTGSHAALSYVTGGAWLVGQGLVSMLRGNTNRCELIREQIVQKRLATAASD